MKPINYKKIFRGFREFFRAFRGKKYPEQSQNLS